MKTRPSLFLSLFTAFVVLAASLAGGHAVPPKPLKRLDPALFNAPIRVACVGDSITQGSGAAKGRSYPSQLQELLGDDWEVGNFGVSGRTLLRKGDYPYWKEAAFQKAQEFLPNVVVIMLGTNDTKPQNWVHVEEFAKDYTDLVNLFLALRSKPQVYVCRPVPVPEPGNYGINEANIQAEIKLLDKLVAELPVGLIDMHAALVDQPKLLPDRVHPNTEGAGVMAQTVAVALTGKKTVESSPVKPNSLFRSHAVLQRDLAMPVWGTAPDGTAVTVEFAGQKVSAVAQNGKWQVQLKPLTVNAKPQPMVISSPVGGVTLRDILVGDVWLASGQSNMERQLGPRSGQPELIGWKEEAASANYPLIRQFYVPHKASADAVNDVQGSWSVCAPETVPNFTAVGYYFARDLFKTIKIPIGIVHSSWGGTPAEAWTSPEALKTLPDFLPQVEAWEAARNGSKVEDPKGAWFAKNDPGSAPGQGWEAPDFVATNWTPAELPQTLTQMALDKFTGIVWFRHEFDLPDAAAGKAATLHLGKIDDQDTTWVNGQLVGHTETWSMDRNYPIAAGTLHAGRNTIAVRLVNVSGGGGWLGLPGDLKLEFAGEPIIAPLALNGPWLRQATVNFAKGPAFTIAGVPSPFEPMTLFRSMLAPLIPFPIMGVIWYQGETNSARGTQYRTLFPAMINDWRQRWNLGPLPFLYVQIAPYKIMTPEIREAQFLTLAKVPNTAMTVLTDFGEAENIHPRHKEPVGQRLALAARALAYDEKIEYSGPLFSAMTLEGSKATLQFTHSGTGLVAKDGPLKGFTIAGADKNFVPAQAEIRGKTVVVWSDQVASPVAVRHGWANVPEVNLFNAEGLPASPFRTDVE